MSMRPALVLVLCVAALLAAAGPAFAGTPGQVQIPIAGADVERSARSNTWFDCCRRPCWDFQVAIPLWIPGVTGTMADGDISFGPEDTEDDGIPDLFDDLTDLKFAFVGDLGVRHGRWGLSVDGFGASLSKGITFKLSDGLLVDGKMAALIARGRVTYELDRRPLGLFGCPACLVTSAYAGVRYYHASFDVNLPFGLSADARHDWFDPLVGLEAKLYWRRWSLRAMGDFGGFGLGGSSDMSYWLSGELEYRFSRVFSIVGGYAWLSVDFQEGSGLGRFAWNVTLSGPVLGLRFQF